MQRSICCALGLLSWETAPTTVPLGKQRLPPQFMTKYAQTDCKYLASTVSSLFILALSMRAATPLTAFATALPVSVAITA